MITEGVGYLRNAVKEYMAEAKVMTLPWVPSPNIDEWFDTESCRPGTFASSAASHLMKIMDISRLCRGDLIVTTSFLARRVQYWSINEDRRLKRLMSYIWHHLEECLVHELNPSDRDGAFLDYSPDAELGRDLYSTKASGGY